MGRSDRRGKLSRGQDLVQSLILDAGVFIALDNPSERGVVLALMHKIQAAGMHPTTNEAALAQAWRDHRKQVPMTMLVKAVTVYPFGDARTIGRRCAQTRTNDVVDASLAVLADQLGMRVLTTDPEDMSRLDVPFEEL